MRKVFFILGILGLLALTAAPTLIEKPPKKPPIQPPAMPESKLKAIHSGYHFALEVLNDPEIQLGGQLASSPVTTRVREHFKQLLRAAGLLGDSAQLYIGQSRFPNAFSIETYTGQDRYRFPGVFITAGTIEAARHANNDAVLSFVLAHEIAHIVLNHTQSMATYQFVGHEKEFDADKLALKILARAGIDPEQAIGAIAALRTETQRVEADFAYYTRRKEGELDKSVARWIDIHPADPVRDAALVALMPEALEIYESSQKDQAGHLLKKITPYMDDNPFSAIAMRIQKELQDIDDQPDFISKIGAFESIMTRWINARKLNKKVEGNRDTKLVIENKIRKLIDSANTLSQLKILGDVLARTTDPIVGPTTRAILDNRKMDVLRKELPKGATLSDLLPHFVGRVDTRTLGRMTVKLLKEIDSREKLEAATALIFEHSPVLELDSRAHAVFFQTLLTKAATFIASDKKSPSEKLFATVKWLRVRLPAGRFTDNRSVYQIASQMINLMASREQAITVKDIVFATRLYLGETENQAEGKWLSNEILTGIIETWAGEHTQEKEISQTKRTGSIQYQTESYNLEKISEITEEDLTHLITKVAIAYDKPKVLLAIINKKKAEDPRFLSRFSEVLLNYGISDPIPTSQESEVLSNALSFIVSMVSNSDDISEINQIIKVYLDLWSQIPATKPMTQITFSDRVVTLFSSVLDKLDKMGEREILATDKIRALIINFKRMSKLPNDFYGLITSAKIEAWSSYVDEKDPAELIQIAIQTWIKLGRSHDLTIPEHLFSKAIPLIQTQEQAKQVVKILLSNGGHAFLVRDTDFDECWKIPVPGRTEAFTDLAYKRHPLRSGGDIGLKALLESLDRFQAWPESFDSKMTLLDRLNRFNHFDSGVDDRIIELAKKNPKEFIDWIKRDDARVRSRLRNSASVQLKKLFPELETELSVNITPHSLGIIRNPKARHDLFLSLFPELKKEFLTTKTTRDVRLRKFGRSPPYKQAQKFFDKEFLVSLLNYSTHEERLVALDQKIHSIIEAFVKKHGKIKGEDGRYLDNFPDYVYGYKIHDQYSRYENNLSEQEFRFHFRLFLYQTAMRAVEEYNSILTPYLAFILNQFPEPTRFRDDLIEDAIRSEKMSPSEIRYAESFKSYQIPNPILAMQNRLGEAMNERVRRLTIEQKKLFLLHISGKRTLSEAEKKTMEDQLFSKKQKTELKDQLSLNSLRELLNHLDFAHPKELELFILSQFFGESSLDPKKAKASDKKEQLEKMLKGLYEDLTVKDFDHPEIISDALKEDYEVLNYQERAVRIARIIRATREKGRALSRSEIFALLVSQGGVVFKKFAQILAQYRGLVPDDYVQALVKFKARAQDPVPKVVALDALQEKISALLTEDTPAIKRAQQVDRPALERIFETIQKTKFETKARGGRENRNLPTPSKSDILRYINAFFSDEKRSASLRISDIEYLGDELGQGSLKRVYLIKLTDGRLWVAKWRIPGVTQSIKRDYEVMDEVYKRLQSSGKYDLSGLEPLKAQIKNLVDREIDFRKEAEIEKTIQLKVSQRGWIANLMKKGGKVIVPQPHPVLVDEDFLIEEYVSTVAFDQLDLKSKVKAAQALIDEATQSMILDGMVNADLHTGNIHVKKPGFLWKLGSRFTDRLPLKLVWIDTGQTVPVRSHELAPFLIVGLDIKRGRYEEAAEKITQMLKFTDLSKRPALTHKIAIYLKGHPDEGVFERIIESIHLAEEERIFISEKYSLLQKAFLNIGSYPKDLPLPQDVIFSSFEKAFLLRIAADEPVWQKKILEAETQEERYGILEDFLQTDFIDPNKKPSALSLVKASARATVERIKCVIRSLRGD